MKNPPLAPSAVVPLAGLVEESVVDGSGIRCAVFVQGCPHRCKGCHNPQTHSFDGGTDTSVAELAERIAANPLLSGVTLSGGEPFCYPEPLSVLAKDVHAHGKNVWCYTGYTYEQLLKKSASSKKIRAFLDEIDVLIDGRFIEARRNPMLKFRGSENQRILNLKSMRASETIEPILWNEAFIPPVNKHT